ncbi:hypothetical protein BASA61_010081 [Batrachochytrium salamandrivorans]|nr:hypothetical protein BASA61_010081 [Batrachochytrium salamandrivorans]KAH9247616.1 hypothetical protein BASA81_014795 [Batrachochytrium salamandrivorans]KAH9276782.1 hypothetical protein BASA83_000917 [Batrachochytrium salamandrivorans]
MKLNALVVAAMVITSVNAAGKGGLLSCFGGICGSGKSKDLEPEEDPVCDSIEAELYALWGNINVLNDEFREQLPRSYRIMMMEEGNDEKGNKGKRGKKSKKDKEEENINSKDQEIRVWLEVYFKDIPDLQVFKAKYDDFEETLDGIWARLGNNECMNRGIKHISLKELAKQGHVPKWYDENGVNFLSKQ